MCFCLTVQLKFEKDIRSLDIFVPNSFHKFPHFKIDPITKEHLTPSLSLFLLNQSKKFWNEIRSNAAVSRSVDRRWKTFIFAATTFDGNKTENYLTRKLLDFCLNIISFSHTRKSLKRNDLFVVEG